MKQCACDKVIQVTVESLIGVCVECGRLWFYNQDVPAWEPVKQKEEPDEEKSVGLTDLMYGSTLGNDDEEA